MLVRSLENPGDTGQNAGCSLGTRNVADRSRAARQGPYSHPAVADRTLAGTSAQDDIQPVTSNPLSVDQPILAAVDFSPHSEVALAWAAAAAKRFGVDLVVLHVVHDPEAAPGSYREGHGARMRRMEEVAADLLAEYLARVRGRHPEVGEPRTLLAVGLPATRILEVAELEDAQLIVVGSQGRTGLAHILLGSKAERVARLSPIPVTIVKAAPRQPPS